MVGKLGDGIVQVKNEDGSPLSTRILFGEGKENLTDLLGVSKIKIEIEYGKPIMIHLEVVSDYIDVQGIPIIDKIIRYQSTPPEIEDIDEGTFGDDDTIN